MATVTAPYLLARGWRAGDTRLLPALRESFTYRPGENRATGWLYLQDMPPVTQWPPQFAGPGRELLLDLHAELGVWFTAVCYQAYRAGAGVSWHHDRSWAAQAILSLGVTRTFGLRSETCEEVFQLAHGDLLYMPPGFQDEWEHCVPDEDVPGERCSLVFRTTTEG